MLAREEKQRGFRQRTGTDSNTLHIAAYQITAARQKKRRPIIGLGIWGAINLLEGYGNDNPGAKSQGMKQLMAGGGVALIGTTLVPLLSGLFG